MRKALDLMSKARIKICSCYRKAVVVRKALGDAKDKTYHMVDKAGFGDWFLLYLISRNMDTVM